MGAQDETAGEHHHVLLTPHRNVWRVERAQRAAVLVDANYFGALRGALLKAQSTVFMLGWDLDSRTRLVGENGKAENSISAAACGRRAAIVRPSSSAQPAMIVACASLVIAIGSIV